MYFNFSPDIVQIQSRKWSNSVQVQIQTPCSNSDPPQSIETDRIFCIEYGILDHSSDVDARISNLEMMMSVVVVMRVVVVVVVM